PDVMDEGIEAERGEAAQIQVQDLERRRFDDHLVLVVVLQTEWIVTVATVGGAARGLQVGGAPRLRPDRAQKGRRVESPGSDFHVVGLQDEATLVRPVALQSENELLKSARRRADLHAWTRG